MAMSLGDTKWFEVLGEHNEIIRRNLKAHGGTEIKSQGDGFMLTFPGARAAMLAMIDIQRDLAERAAGGTDAPIRIRIGMHTGEAIVDAEGDLFGKHIIMAARIGALAEGGQILASSITKEITSSRGDLAFGPAQEVTLKGIEGTYQVYEVLWTDPATTDDRDEHVGRVIPGPGRGRIRRPSGPHGTEAPYGVPSDHGAWSSHRALGRTAAGTLPKQQGVLGACGGQGGARRAWVQRHVPPCLPASRRPRSRSPLRSPTRRRPSARRSARSTSPSPSPGRLTRTSARVRRTSSRSPVAQSRDGRRRFADVRRSVDEDRSVTSRSAPPAPRSRPLTVARTRSASTHPPA